MTARFTLGAAVVGLLRVVPVVGATGTGTLDGLDMTVSMSKCTLVAIVKWSCNALLVQCLRCE